MRPSAARRHYLIPLFIVTRYTGGMKGNTITRISTAWDESAEWYQGLVGRRGMELQQKVVFPAALQLLDLKSGHTLLDVACGQGAFCREARKYADVAVGIDASRALIEFAKKTSPRDIRFFAGDARSFPDDVKRYAPFDAVSCILALGNIDEAGKVFDECADVLKPRGRFVFVITHPCFRIPRQSGWGWDEKRKLQYRRIDRYLSEMKIPIIMHPGIQRSEVTWTYHRPIQSYAAALRDAGFAIDAIEELTTTRQSTPGPRARADQRSKEEIPLFLAVRAVKCRSQINATGLSHDKSKFRMQKSKVQFKS